MASVLDLCDGNLESLCCLKRAGGKNTFCARVNCTVDHRGDSSTKISLELDSIVVLRTKDSAFISPIGSGRLISTDVLLE